jgi:iron complex outermembrane receptor protein
LELDRCRAFPQTGFVFGEETDTVLEDIDRIEVIRGPGAALWGANAVSGVTNIITKSAKETQGTLVSGGGVEERGFGTVRYGGRLATNLSMGRFPPDRM